MFGFIGKIGGFVRDFFHFPLWVPLGRVAYCIYLVHFIVFRFLTGDFMALPTVSNPQIVSIHCVSKQMKILIFNYFSAVDFNVRWIFPLSFARYYLNGHIRIPIHCTFERTHTC